MKSRLKIWMLIVSCAFSCAMLVVAATYVWTKADQMPVNHGPFDGRRLYNEAFRIVSNEHYALGNRSPEQIAAWKEEWQNKFSDEDLATPESADEAIRKMITSLKTKWDHLYSPLKKKAEAAPAPGTYAAVKPVAQAGLAAAADLGDGIYLIRLESFDDGSADNFFQVLSACKNPKGIIVDLIGNPGGNMLEAAQILAMFVPQGVVCRQRSFSEGRMLEDHNIIDDNGLRIDSYRINGNGTLSYNTRLQLPRYPLVLPLSVPIAVTVNADSASAAEMVTAALKRFRNATVVGKRTTGKGVFQRVHPMSFGRSLAVTAGEYRIDADRRIHEIGIVPDLDGTPGKEDFSQEFYLGQLKAAHDRLKDLIAEKETWQKRATTAGVDLKKLDSADWTVGPGQVESELDRQAPIKYGWRRFGLLAFGGMTLTIIIWAFFMRLAKRRMARTQEAMADVDGTWELVEQYFKLRKIDPAKQPGAMKIANQAQALEAVSADVADGKPASVVLEQLVAGIARSTGKLKDAIAQRACSETKRFIAQVQKAIDADQSGGEHIGEAVAPLQSAEDIIRFAGEDGSGKPESYIRALELVLEARAILVAQRAGTKT